VLLQYTASWVLLHGCMLLLHEIATAATAIALRVLHDIAAAAIALRVLHDIAAAIALMVLLHECV